jgi:hypothetical protein
MKFIPFQVAIFLVLLAGGAEAGQAAATLNGPPPPEAPNTISRDETGRATVRAVRLTEPLRVDGDLNEAVYASVPAMTGFYQMEPRWSEPASQKTEVWVFFDDKNLYAAARVWEDHPERMVLNEWRRDTTGIFQNEVVGFAFDTFHDKRNAIVLNVTALGARQDVQVTDERDWNSDWNPAWRTKVGRFAGGWTIELEMPFKSLRYKSEGEQVWGFNVHRNNRWKNELAYLVPLPRAWQTAGLGRPSMAPALVGIETPRSGKALDIKPFLISRLTTDRLANPIVSNDFKGDGGVDVKWAPTRALTADFTYRTDFAQAEADQAQTNLTRFSLFFPEKREFFLENRGVFTFGGVGSQTPILFYSRQIGLSQGREVPVQGGGRLTGRIGTFNVGLLSIRQEQDAASGTAATTFSVARVRRDILRYGSVGAMFTDRSVATSGVGRHESYGADAQLIFFRNLAFNAYWAQTRPTAGSVPTDNASYRTQVDYSGDLFGLQIDHLAIGAGFNPEIGFVPRGNMRRTFAQPRYSLRPHNSGVIRRYNFIGTVDYITNHATGRLESRLGRSEFNIDLQNSDTFRVFADNTREAVTRPFTIGPNVPIAAGSYDFNNFHVEYGLGRQRKLSGVGAFERGSFFGGEKTSVSFAVGGFNAARLQVSQRLSVEPGLTINRVTLPARSFTTRLITANTIFGVTPTMFATALIQYNSDTHLLSSNVRLRWEYQPGSELFVVYNDQRDRASTIVPGLQNRSFIVKVNRLFRF